jgi:hypothetical protein
MPVLGPSIVAYWPVGDVYQLTPKWRESHTDVDNTVRPQDEINRLEIVGDYGASEIWFSITMMDMTDPDNPVPPTEVPSIFANLTKPEGWMDYQSIEPVFVMVPDEVMGEVWGGEVKFNVAGVKEWIGIHSVVNLTIDAEFPSDAPERIRAGYGTLVLRD